MHHTISAMMNRMIGTAIRLKFTCETGVSCDPTLCVHLIRPSKSLVGGGVPAGGGVPVSALNGAFTTLPVTLAPVLTVLLIIEAATRREG